jgi:hypothetical protein
MSLLNRSSDGLEVTLVWVHGHGEDKAVVCVCDAVCSFRIVTNGWDIGLLPGW